MAFITQTVRGPVATFTLNRPEKRNALNDEMIEELRLLLTEAADREELRVLVITGAGTSFCAGADLQQLEEMQEQSAMENRRDSHRLADLFKAIYYCDRPVIARINGDAFGGGAGIIAACDWGFASEEARIGFPEVRLGFVPAVVMPFLIRRVGERIARDLLLRGRRMEASEAADVGLVYEAVAPEKLAGAVDALVDEIVRETSASAITLTKRLLGVVPGMDLDRAVDLGALTNAFARGTEDCRAGISAFLSGDPPPWKGSSPA